MDNSQQVLKAKAVSRKMLFIVAVFSLVAIFTLISALDFFSLEEFIEKPLIFDTSIDDMLDGTGLRSVVYDIAKAVDGIVVTFRLIKWLPNLAVAVAWFLIFFGAKKENAKLFSFGFLVFKIQAIYNLASIALLLLVGLIASIVLKIPFGFVLLLLLIFAGANVLPFLYYSKILKMSYPFSLTFKSGRNRVYVYRFILFYLMFNAVRSFWGVLKSLIGFDAIEILVGLSVGLVDVFLFLLLREYRAEVGNAEPQTFKDIFVYRREEKDLSESAPKQRPAVTVREAAPKNAEPAQSQPKTKRSLFASAASHAKTDSAAAKLSAAIANVSDGQSFEDRDTPLDSKVLRLFDRDKKTLSDNFVVLGEENYPEQKDNPVSIVAMQVVKDKISERKIIRFTVRNHSSAVITGITLQIVPVSHLCNRLGIMDNVEFDAGKVPSGEDCLSEFGVIMPDEFSGADVRIVRMVFENGLYWDRGSKVSTLSTFEKKEFDKKLFMEYFNGWGAV